MRRSAWLVVPVCAAVAAVSCSSATEDGSGFAGTGPGSGGGGGAGGIWTGGSGGTGIGLDAGDFESGSDCAESAKLIYVVSEQKGLYSFNPTIDGLAAYKKVGDLKCPSQSSPQSMGIDRAGTAYVFYSSGELFQVRTTDAACSSTSYQHPGKKAFNQLGMGFTADTAGSSAQTLYIVSPDFGLATIEVKTLAVQQKNALKGEAAELTGGPDARLFLFAAQSAKLSEVDLGSLKLTALHTFSEFSDVLAWAFARYAGKFYMFTASGTMTAGPTKTTIYDADTQQSTLRDANIGFTVVGAGQSTCVPPPPPK
jgi:hypothetical protein